METQSLAPVLKEHPFFQGLAPKHIELLVGCASNVRFNPGETIFKFGEKANRFYVLRSGKVAVEIDVPQKGHVIIQTLRDGDVLGWSWLFPPFIWNFDTRALELTRAIALDSTCLLKSCEEDHGFGYEMLKRFSAIMLDRLKATRLQLVDLYGKPSGRER